MRVRFIILTVLLMSGCFLLGCAAPKEEPRYVVSGTVKVGGKPLTKGWITFHPDKEQGNISTYLPVSEIKSDGTYELNAYNEQGGAVRGQYKVVVVASKDPIPLRPERNPDGSLKGIIWLTHAKYTRVETTDLHLEVIENAPAGHYDLQLSR